MIEEHTNKPDIFRSLRSAVGTNSLSMLFTHDTAHIFDGLSD